MMRNTLERRDPSKLKNHPLNIKIYGDVVDPDFVESCKAGIVSPIVITTGNVVISGHRRRQAAIKLGIAEVPVIVRHDLTDELEIELALLRANDQREKTNEQKAREYNARVRIEQELAKRRQKLSSGRGQKGSEKFTTFSGTGKAKDIAAESVGMSQPTAEKAAKVVKEIDAAEQSGKPEVAAELRETLNQNVAKAHRQVAEKPDPDAVLDGTGKPVPDKFASIFEARDEFKSALSKLQNLVAVSNTLAKSAAGAHLSPNALKADFDNLRRQLRFAMPYKVCPYCAGKKAKCECCKGLGWVTESQYKQAPVEMRA